MKKEVLGIILIFLIICFIGFANGQDNVSENETQTVEEETEEVEIEETCTDSDGGKNYYVRGTMEIICTPGEPCSVALCKSVPALGEEPSSTCLPPSDWCVSEFILNEGYCENGNILFEEYTCPNGCQNGVCLEKEEPKPPKEQCESGEIKYYICSDGTKIPSCECERGMWVCMISPESACPDAEVPKVCANKIEINFDKNSYVVGEQFEVKVRVFDSAGNPISNYPFYVEMYDDRWHTPDLQRTDAGGFFRHTGTAEKMPNGITNVKFKVYTKQMMPCGVVEDTTQLEIRQAPVPCGIGGCIPEEDKEQKIKEEKRILSSCAGCDVDGKCYPLGYRKEGVYCSDNYEFVSQIEEGKCNNNFECKSNVCISGECVGEGLIKKIIAWFKKMFGGEGDEEKPKECSKLLIEKDIGDNEYIKSGYGENEHAQVPVYSEDGENIKTIKCCMADYSTAATMVCAFDGKEEVRTSLKWILSSGKGTEEFGEYKGEKIITNGMIAWTSKNYLIVSGGKPEAGNRFVEDIVDSYLKEYPDDFDLTKEDIPYIVPQQWVACTEEDEEAIKKCQVNGGKLQTDPHPDKECEVYVGCILSSEPVGYRNTAKEFLIKAESIGSVELIDFETLADGTILQNGDKLTGKEWESLGVVFEFPSEDYLQVFGPMYPFNPLDKLSLSPGLGPFEAGGNTHDDLNIIFSEPVKAAGIYLLDLGETDDRESITFLDKNNNVIEKISPWPKSTFGNPAPGTFVGLIHDGISKIEILENTQDSDDIAYDNLYFVR